MGIFSRRDFLSWAAPALATQTRGKPARPNVILILTDDQGYGDLSCHGNPVLKTPHMDRLHSQSVRFTDFHSSPMCSPTRGQLLTGLDALRNGATFPATERSRLRQGITTMADVFAANRYATGIFGKWHLGDNYPYRPIDRGFQEAKYHLSYGLSSSSDFDNDYFDGRYVDNKTVRRFPGYCTDFWFGEAMGWMRSRQLERKPFFCYLPTNVPHGPQWVSDQYSNPYRKEGQPAAFYGMIANLDENIGKLEGFLEESGLREDTILMFLTDNGTQAGHRVFNAGMRGAKRSLYEGGHRVPCFIRWPSGGLGPAADIDEPAQVQDILPTLVDLCALPQLPNSTLDGRSLAPLARGAVNSFAGRMMVVQYGIVPKKWDACVIWGKWRLVGQELYDIGSDPGQIRDVAPQQSEVVQRMRDHYKTWWAGVAPALGKPSPSIIGSRHENPVHLNSGDWDEFDCNDVQCVTAAQGGPKGRPWNVLVDRGGEYEVMISRWPQAWRLPLSAGRPAQKMTAGSLPPGKAIPISGAKLHVSGRVLSTRTTERDHAATFRFRLAAGAQTQIQGWFHDLQGNDVCGAYYASIRRI